jgi:hypothetical protein
MRWTNIQTEFKGAQINWMCQECSVFVYRESEKMKEPLKFKLCKDFALFAPILPGIWRKAEAVGCHSLAKK